MLRPNHATSRSHDRAPQLLQDHLAEVMGDAALASAALADALQNAGRASVPNDASEIVIFAWAHLVGVVATSAGVRRATTFVARLQRALEENSARSVPRLDVARPTELPTDSGEVPQVSEVRAIGDGLRVMIVEVDALDRAMLARALVRTGVRLAVADSLEDLVARPRDLEGMHILKCNFDMAGAAAALRTLVRRAPGFGVVARASESESASSALRLAGVAFFEVLPARPATSEAASSILTLARAVRDDQSR